MKSRFIAKKKRKKKRKVLFVFLMIGLGLWISYQKLEQNKITIKDKEFINILMKNSYTYQKENVVEKVMEKTLEVMNPLKLMKKEYSTFKEDILEENIEGIYSPIIYLYNTHQTEEYAPSSFAEFSINPTVIMNDYILEDIFQKKGISTFVEEESIKDILRENNWRYVDSYKASRLLLEKRILEYPSLKYFIDIHRDSLTKDKTTIQIEDKSYAKILFIVGLENENYEKNLNFTNQINEKIKEKYPGLSKGIYQKGGVGVNGIYNQDFSEYTILIEIGGYENTTNEVLNSALAFSECFWEVIHESNH